jgi:uncharacterized membrane protein YccC
VTGGPFTRVAAWPATVRARFGGQHEVTAPIRWVARGVRTAGPERRRLVQAAKAALAAVGSWILATTVLHLPQPFLAPYAAVFLVQATVYRSLLNWAQQVGAVAGGVVLAALAAQWIPSMAVGLGAVVFVGLVVGGWRVFGESGPWIGITGMLLITYGSASHELLLFDRLLETALGAAIGTVVNALVFPPLYGDRATAVTKDLSAALGEVLASTAIAVRTDEPADSLDECRPRMAEARALVDSAQEAAGWHREARRLNLRRAVRGDWHDRPLATLMAVWPAVGHLLAAVRTLTEREHPFRYPAFGARDAFADLLDSLAGAVRRLGDDQGPDADDVAWCREMMEAVNKYLTVPSEAPADVAGLGGIVLPARHILRELESG